ncbi:tyrosine-type recombinase/integrase [Nonomuraea fuscirosea]|uniref:tyrosine-type recombinase/integrase n=1 Tax=Nonomuraea fuscirosea TaxID=1291556 RepID=UPI0034188C70
MALPQRCVDVLQQRWEDQRQSRGDAWSRSDLDFASATGAPFDAANVRRDFRNAIQRAKGVDPRDWTPRKLRHSFVSLLSASGVPLAEISRLVGHGSTAVAEAVYRKQIRPSLQSGAVAMDQIFR